MDKTQSKILMLSSSIRNLSENQVDLIDFSLSLYKLMNSVIAWCMILTGGVFLNSAKGYYVDGNMYLFWFSVSFAVLFLGIGLKKFISMFIYVKKMSKENEARKKKNRIFDGIDSQSRK